MNMSHSLAGTARLIAMSGAMLTSIATFADDPYVQFEGKQLVYTSCFPDSSSRIEIDLALDDTNRPQQRVCAAGTDGENDLCFHLYENGGGNWALNFDGTTVWKSTSVHATTARLTIVVDSANDRMLLVTEDGRSTNDVSFVFASMTHRGGRALTALRLGGTASTIPDQLAKMKLYGLRYFEGGVEKHRYEPRLCGGVAGLLDTVGDDGFVYDDRATTDASYLLKYGGDIREVPYIETLGQAGKPYGKTGINTRFVPSTNSRLEVDVAYTDVEKNTEKDNYQQRIFQAGGNLMMASYINGSGNIGFGYGKQDVSGDQTYSALYGKRADLFRHRIIADYPSLTAMYMTGAKKSGTLGLNVASISGHVGNYPVILGFASGSASGFKFWEDQYAGKVRFYRVKAYESGVLVHDYVPCLKGGVPGLRDKVDGAFVTAENVDMLTYGGDIETLEDDFYVELTGNGGGVSGTETKYISLDCSVKPSTRVELDCALAENVVAGSSAQFAYFIQYYKDPADANNVQRFYVLGPGTGGKSYWYRLGKGSGHAITTDVDLSDGNGKNVRRTFILDSPNKQVGMVTAGYTNVLVSTGDDTVTAEMTTATLRLGANFDPAAFAPLKIYGCKVFENGVLKHDYRPCMTNALFGLIDTLAEKKTLCADSQVNAKRLTPGGVYEPDVASKAVYLEFDGNQAIDTGYKPNPKTRIETDFQLVQADPAQQRIWCADGGITYHLYSNGGCIFAFKCSTRSDWNGTAFNFMSLERMTHVLDVPRKQVRFLRDCGTRVDNFDSKFDGMEGYATTTCTGTLSIGGHATETGGNPRGHMRLYGLRIFEDGVMVHDYVPYKSADGLTIGLYDQAEGVSEERRVLTDSRAAWHSSPFKIGGMNAQLEIVPTDATVDVQQKSTLVAYASAAVSYKWYKDGSEIDGETGASLTVTWRKGLPHEEVYAVRPVYSVAGCEVVGAEASAIVTYARKGMIIVVQ